MLSPFIGAPDTTPVVHADTLVSTNAEAFRLLSRGEAGPRWVTATRQTGGRGRQGRSWESLPGNLHASLLFCLGWDLRDLPLLSLAAGVALAEAAAGIGSARADHAPNARPKLKWPNDLMLGEAKCAGVLIESGPVPAAGCHGAVIGFGVNIAAAPSIVDRAVTSLAAHGIETTAEALRVAIDAELRRAFAMMAGADGRDRLRQAWLAHAPQVGARLSIRVGGTVLAGRFAGLGEDGALLIEDASGQMKSISHGDVSAGGAIV